MVLYLREITLASKSGDSVYAKRMFFFAIPDGAYPRVATCLRMIQDFSGLFGKLLCRLRKTTTFGTVNAKLILDVLPKAPKTLFSQ